MEKYLFIAGLVGMAWGVAAMAFLLWRRKVHGPHFPARDEVHVLFDERWTSGRSFKSLLTRLGGANKCLRVTVTDDELWITPHFPFSAFAATYDLDHRARRDAVRHIERHRRNVTIDFVGADGQEHRLELRLRDADGFVAALSAPGQAPGAAQLGPNS